MQKRFLYMVVVAIALAIAGNTYAGIHWLPDYLGNNMDRSNMAGDGGTSSDNRQDGCPNGWLTVSEIGDKSCVLKGTFSWVGKCYGDCICDVTKYKYTEENCTGEGYLAGSRCSGDKEYYTECRSSCDEVTDNLINPTWGCEKTYEECPSKCEMPYEDNCHNRTHNEGKGYGCKPDGYYDDCSSKCEDPYEDNCHNRTDNSTEYGCQPGGEWDDCPTKCQYGATCSSRNCVAEGFTLSSCPSNATCAECSPGCGNSTKYYKFTMCKTGYFDMESFFCDNSGAIELCTWALPSN